MPLELVQDILAQKRCMSLHARERNHDSKGTKNQHIFEWIGLLNREDIIKPIGLAVPVCGHGDGWDENLSPTPHGHLPFPATTHTGDPSGPFGDLQRCPPVTVRSALDRSLRGTVEVRGAPGIVPKTCEGRHRSAGEPAGWTQIRSHGQR